MNDITREELNARLETIETRMDGRLSSIEQMIGAKFAEFGSTLHKSNADTVKWVAGIVLAVGAAGLALMTFLINNITPRPMTSASPIVITLPGTASTAPQRPAGQTSPTPQR